MDIVKIIFRGSAYSLIIIRNGELLFSSKESGINPLIYAISGGSDFESATMADRVIGKAAALLG
ncbi:MAG: DUF1893 domain-containing protein, partial [Candidatus Eremiobacteraeota bacterium]|nr:DUF1893 domain-containing protein [Candidatus Eremiobacteraeota bacterium]